MAGAREIDTVSFPVEGDEWDRAGTRGDGARMTVAGIGRFTLHEVVHHRGDAEARLA